MQLLVFCFFFTIQRRSLWRRPFNPEVLSPHSQAMLFYVWRFGCIHTLPHLHGFTGFMQDLWWKYLLTSSVLFSPGTCSASRAVITRWDLAQRDQMTQVFLVQAVLVVARLTWLPTGWLTPAMCSAVEADVSLHLCEHCVPGRNVSNIYSNILVLYLWNTSSKLSGLMTPQKSGVQPE